jgi:hypothetical protein
MATATGTELFERLRNNGLRKSTARKISDAIEGGSKRTPKQVRNLISDLGDLATELEDRAKNGPAKRNAAAKKGAATRKRAARRRSEAAKKAARTRKRNA